jgi:RNAse (barnase) inhibitor barstar
MEDSEEYDASDVILVLDATHWNSDDDVYDSFFEAVGAPSWHGRNLDALNDSIAHGCINLIETPYTLIIKNYGKMGYGARGMAKKFVDFISELEERGTRVSIQVEG